VSNVHLSIGTATDRINLIQPSRIGVYEWEPSETPLADTFSESSLGDGRILSSYREENAIESFGLHLKGGDPDSLIEVSRDIRKMLITARDYWTTAWQGDPVYLKARGACETNFRYALVYTGRMPSDILPWGDAFARENVMHERTLVVERGPWMNAPPGTGNCIDITASQTQCYPYCLEFGGYPDAINGSSDVQLDDIPSGGAITVDGWIRPSAWPTGAHTIIGKNEGTPAGWILQIEAGKGLISTVYCDGAADAYSESGVDDGVAAEFYEGDIGWIRVSDIGLHVPGIDFDAPSRCTVPRATANTMGLWIFEGTGTTTGNAGAGTTAGQFVGSPTWLCECPETFGSDAEADPVVIVGGPGARAYHDTVQNINDNSWDPLSLNSERWDDGNMHSIVGNTERFTIGETGFYIISAGVYHSSYTAATTHGVEIVLNGTTVIARQVYGTQSDYARPQVCTFYYLSAGDYVDIRAFQVTGGVAQIVSAANYSPEFTIQEVPS
jgi:hypothetical protein